MDLTLIVIGFFLIFIGLIGSFIPVIPGPITSWLGLLILHQASFMESSFTFLAITFSIAIGIFILDYFIPLIGLKNLEEQNQVSLELHSDYWLDCYS